MPSLNLGSLPEPWRAFLTEVDEALEQEVILQCLGGFVLAALYDLPRPTGHIDYISINPYGVETQVTAPRFPKIQSVFSARWSGRLPRGI